MSTASITSQLQQSAISIISQNPNGIRYTPLKTRLQQQFPQTPEGTIHGAIWLLPSSHPSKVYKLAQGLYAPVGPANPSTLATAAVVVPPLAVSPPSEKQFYQPFAVYLQSDLEEATVAEELGGAVLQTKWGTPDVVGVYKAPPGAVVDFNKEIISAEIKINPSEYVTAFGQATAYMLFSTKVYVVMPETLATAKANREASDRLEALCMLFGIGYITFDASNVQMPNWSTRIRARRHTPEMYYVNKFAEDLKKNPSTQSLFKRLF